MNNTTSLTQNQISHILSDNLYQEPNIRKAEFVVSQGRIYTLEFDQNIEMQELKIMIQKAAHLKKNTFCLYCNGMDYTQYNEETFDYLFPDQTLVVFTLELIKGADNLDETELLLQINMPCPEHDYKFLLYYCFDCGKSICSECFTKGAHKGHQIQDKCFYLLPSKYLVAKMFENWSNKPYEDFQILIDLNEFKNKLNNDIFKELFELLKETQKKCNELIDKYNFINQKSLYNIRDSVRNIKISCIKALDEYKDLINIKDIINNEEIFIDFDHTYKDMGNKQKEKFKENLLKFQELNKGVSILVENLINDVCQTIKNALIKAIDNEQYKDVEQKINLKLIKPVDKDDIINQISDKKIKMKRNKKNDRKTMNNYNKFVNKISEGVELEFEKNKNDNLANNNIRGRNTIIPENLPSKITLENNNNNNEDNLNELSCSNGKPTTINNGLNNNDDINRNNNININNNYSVDSTLKKPGDNNNENTNLNHILNNTNQKNNIQTINPFKIDSNNNSINNNNPFDIPNKNENSSSNLNMPTNQSGITNYNFEKPKNLYDNKKEDENNVLFSFNEQNNNLNPFTKNSYNDTNIDNNDGIKDNVINNQKEPQNKEGKPIKNIFDSILNSKQNKNSDNLIPNTISNEKMNNTVNMISMNEISPIPGNRIVNSSNGIFSNNSSFNSDCNNNSARPNKVISIVESNFNTQKDSSKNPFYLENYNNNNNSNNNSNKQISFNPNKNPQNLILESPFSKNKSNNTNNSNNNSNISSNQNTNNNNNSNSIIFKNKTNIIEMDSKYLTGLANNCKTILEEINESGSELKPYSEKKINIEYYLNKPYILCPIPTTNKLKIITEKEKDENIISLKFPENSNISSFLFNCAYCNYNKKLYISGGILNLSSNLYSNKFYMIDLNNNDSYITELSPMIYSRSNHSMIGYNNIIYAVGGEDTNTVEQYDIIKNKWTEINPMIKKKSNTMLAIDNGFLYTFFGKGENGKYPECIERLNIEKSNSIWEMILYSNPSNIDTRCYGCGLYPVDELIYFIGGKCNGEAVDNIFFFNYIERRIDISDSKLKWKESFRENTLFQLGNKIVQVSEGKFFGVYLKIMVE